MPVLSSLAPLGLGFCQRLPPNPTAAGAEEQGSWGNHGSLKSGCAGSPSLLRRPKCGEKGRGAWHSSSCAIWHLDARRGAEWEAAEGPEPAG